MAERPADSHVSASDWHEHSAGVVSMFMTKCHDQATLDDPWRPVSTDPVTGLKQLAYHVHPVTACSRWR